MVNVDFIGMVVGAVLTLMIFSYLLGDNPLYRLALHLFIGALVGYSFGIVLRDILFLKVLAQLIDRQYIVVLPLVFGLLLLIKGFPRHAYLGNFSVAYLVGVGTAVTLSGTLLGTLVPQIEATGQALSLEYVGSLEFIKGLLIVGGTICTLMTFSFTLTRRTPQGLAGLGAQFVGLLGWIGRGFLTVALAVAFAGALTASLSIFINQVQYLIQFFVAIAGPPGS